MVDPKRFLQGGSGFEVDGAGEVGVGGKLIAVALVGGGFVVVVEIKSFFFFLRSRSSCRGAAVATTEMVEDIPKSTPFYCNYLPQLSPGTSVREIRCLCC